MLKTIVFTALLAITSLIHAAGSCDYCLEDCNREWSACKGDQQCRAQADVNFQRCKRDCPKK